MLTPRAAFSRPSTRTIAVKAVRIVTLPLQLVCRSHEINVVTSSHRFEFRVGVPVAATRRFAAKATDRMVARRLPTGAQPPKQLIVNRENREHVYICAPTVPVSLCLPRRYAGVCAKNNNNGFPPGGHYTLNIQGKTNCAGSDLMGSNRHTIQVLLNVQSNQDDLIDRRNKIFLEPGPPGSQPQVLDGNACDRGGALFQLPIDVSNSWTAYARALSKPETSMNITSCAVDEGLDLIEGTLDDVVLCSRESARAHAQVGQAGDHQRHR